MIKILYYFADYGDFMSGWQYIHFIDELKKHEVSFDILNPLDYENYDQSNEAIIKQLKSAKYDLFMTSCKSDRIYIQTLKEIKKLSIPSLLFCTDNLHDPYTHKKIMSYFDLVWLTSWETEKMIKSWGANTIFLPYAANPYSFNPTKEIEESKVVGFIGTPYGTRACKFNELTSNGVNCAVYHGGRQQGEKKKFALQEPANSRIQQLTTISQLLSFSIGRKMLLGRVKALFHHPELIDDPTYLVHHPSLSFEDMINQYHSFALALNVLELRNTYLLQKPVYKIHLRSFEIPMCGGLQFTSYNEELASYFEEDKEIIFYRNKDEFIDKAKFYLSDTQYEKRIKMKQAARLRAEREHTWWHRFEILFNTLGITNSTL